MGECGSLSLVEEVRGLGNGVVVVPGWLIDPVGAIASGGFASELSRPSGIWGEVRAALPWEHGLIVIVLSDLLNTSKYSHVLWLLDLIVRCKIAVGHLGSWDVGSSGGLCRDETHAWEVTILIFFDPHHVLGRRYRAVLVGYDSGHISSLLKLQMLSCLLDERVWSGMGPPNLTKRLSSPIGGLSHLECRSIRGLIQSQTIVLLWVLLFNFQIERHDVVWRLLDNCGILGDLLRAALL